LFMADHLFSTPGTNSNGKRKRSRKLCGGRRNSREIECEINECIGKVGGQATGLVRDYFLNSCVEVRRELCFSDSGIGAEANTPTGETSVLHKASSGIGTHRREMTEDHVEWNPDGPLVEVEELKYAADEQMIEEIDVEAPIVDEEELEVEDDVRVEVGEEDADLVCDQIEPNDDVNEQGSIVPSPGDAVRIRCEVEKLASVFLKPTNLISLMLTSGTQRFTREQFEEHSVRASERCWFRM
jgi:hypothetical protein